MIRRIKKYFITKKYIIHISFYVVICPIILVSIYKSMYTQKLKFLKARLPFDVRHAHDLLVPLFVRAVKLKMKLKLKILFNLKIKNIHRKQSGISCSIKRKYSTRNGLPLYGDYRAMFKNVVSRLEQYRKCARSHLVDISFIQNNFPNSVF